MEFLALYGNVPTDGSRRPFTVGSLDGGNDVFMFGHGLFHAPAHAQLHPSEGLQTPLKAKAFLLQKTVA